MTRVDEEYDLLRKFVNFHFSSLTYADTTIDDLNIDFTYSLFPFKILSFLTEDC